MNSPARRRASSLARAIGCSLVAGGAALGMAEPVLGQDTERAGDSSANPIRVLVTGSNIPTAAAESALPVQVITRDEIEHTNLQTAAELVNSLSMNTSFGAYNETQALGASDGIGQAGFAGSGLRGLGYQATLVLVNGRRIANYAFTTLGADLNAIPLSAVDRVEVLKDGASAVYGSDALAGVINFILRRDVQGASASAQYTSPEHIGGYAKHASASLGYGDLVRQGFNVTANVDYQSFGAVRARDRAFAARNYIPEQDLDRTDIHSLPANADTPVGVRNPSGDPLNGYVDPTCLPPRSFPTANGAERYQCRYGGDGSATIVDPSERFGLTGSLTWQLDGGYRLFADTTYARNRFTFVTWPAQVSQQTSVDSSQHFLLPVTSAFYPHAFASAFGIDGTPLNLYWSADDLGPRSLEAVSSQWNAVTGVQGNARGWSYDAAFDYSRSDVTYRAAAGYLRASELFPILNSGSVNPFGLNTPDVVAGLSSAGFDGTLRTGSSTLASFEAKASKDVLTLPAGAMSVAVGAAVRREALVQTSDPALASGDVLDVSATPSLAGSRRIFGVFAEASTPLTHALEADIAVRYDHYSDFGGTTNPKLALRWQPVANLVLRASVGSGYFAPSLAGLHSPPEFSFTSGNVSDPARCLVTGSAQDCNRRFPLLGGGNPGLLPTRSTQWSAGAVWSPLPSLTLGIDYVSILLDDRINFFPVTQILGQCVDGVHGPTCYLVHRGSIDPAFPALPGLIERIDQFLTNLGRQSVNAFDLDLRYATPRGAWGRVTATLTGTYTLHNKRQQLNGSYLDLVDHYAAVGGNPGAIPYWRHHLVVDWNRGPWAVTVDELFQRGTYDQLPGPGTGTALRRIGDYDLWNIRVAYAGFRGWVLASGIKNLFDRNPPFSNQTQSFQVGYDPTYADPRGRLYWTSAQYTFR